MAFDAGTRCCVTLTDGPYGVDSLFDDAPAMSGPVIFRPPPGATPEEIMEAIWVAAAMRAGGAYAHAAVALDEMTRGQAAKTKPP